MKFYYTLVQPFGKLGQDLANYLELQDIKYTIGADTAKELRRHGLKFPYEIEFMYRYIVLIEPHELSAIILSCPDIEVIKNRTEYNLRNKIRGWFK